MRFQNYINNIFYSGEQIFLLFVIIFLYLVFLFFIRNKNFSTITHIFIFTSFIYSFFLINLSFFPFHRVGDLKFNDLINFVPFSTFNENKNFIFSFLLIIPAGFLYSYFIGNLKKNIIFGAFLSIIIEFIQLFILYFSIKNGFGSIRPFSIDDIIIRFLGFLIGILIFKILEKFLKK